MSSISVIIPAFNVEDYIAETIESVLSQSVLPDEIIIINDGSTDRTLDILHKYETHKIITVISTPNMGQGNARNRGLIESHSDYIYFFDSDDILESNFIEEMKVNIKKYDKPELILFSGQSFLDKHYRLQTNFFPDYDRRFNSYYDDSYKLISSLMKHRSFLASPCLYISQRQLWIDKNLNFKSIVHEDEELIFKLAAHSQTSLVLRDIFFRRRIRNDSVMTTNKTEKNLNGYIESLKSMYSFKKEYPTLYNKLEPLWKERVYILLRDVLTLMYRLQHLTFEPIIIKALYDTYSVKRASKLVLRIKNRYLSYKKY